MNQPPKETWCKSCEGEGYIVDGDGESERRERCIECDGSGETAASLNWSWPGSERDGVR